MDNILVSSSQITMKPQKPRRPPKARSRYEVSSVFGRLGRINRASVSLDSPRWMLILLVVLIGLILVLISRWFLNDQMIVTEIRVIEPYTLSAGNIKQATNDLMNRNILVLNLEDIWATVTGRNNSTVQRAAQRLREQPGIKNAQIFCGNESRQQCEVQIEPNPPIAVFQTAAPAQQAVMYLDDRGGVWTGQYAVAMEKLKNDPSLLGITLEKDTILPPAGTTEFRDKPYILQALIELRQQQPDVRDYFYSTKTGRAFETTQKTRDIVVFAERPNLIAEKLRMAEQIRAERSAKGPAPKIIDVRYLEAPTYR